MNLRHLVNHYCPGYGTDSGIPLLVCFATVLVIMHDVKG